MKESLKSKLKRARQKLGYSQAKAAEAWKIPLSTLVNWENERRTPRGVALTLLEGMLDGILAEKPGGSRKAKR